MPREHRSGGHDALRRQTKRLRGIFTCKRQDEQLQRRATAENDWQVLERCVCQTHASCMAYDVFPLYSLLLRAYAHPQHPDRSLDLKPQYLRHCRFIHASADLNSAEIGLYRLREPCHPILEPKPLP